MDEQRRNDAALLAALEPFEAALLRPVVPGELDAWSREVVKAARPLAVALPRWLASRERLFRDILKQDIVLAPRVETMRAHDDELRRTLTGGIAALKSLGAVADAGARTSAEPDRTAEELREDLLGQVVACRAAIAEATTWFLEALYRDRGFSG